MTYTIKAAEYLRGCGATNDEIDDCFDFCSTIEDGGKKVRYEVYRLWARLLRHRRTLYKKHGRFDFHDDLKWYLRDVTKREVADDDLPSHAIYVNSESFVKFVVRHLVEAL